MADELEQRLIELEAERRRLGESTARVGAALEAAHDSDQLLRVIVDTAVEATRARRRVRSWTGGRELARAGDPDAALDKVIAFPAPGARAPSTSGRSFSRRPEFDVDQIELASSLARNAGRSRAGERTSCTGSWSSRLSSIRLTELANRRLLEETLQAEVARATRFGGDLSLVLADLDGFKDVNDRFGHPSGDLCSARSPGPCARRRGRSTSPGGGAARSSRCSPGHGRLRRRRRRRARVRRSSRARSSAPGASASPSPQASASRRSWTPAASTFSWPPPTARSTGRSATARTRSPVEPSRLRDRSSKLRGGRGMAQEQEESMPVETASPFAQVIQDHLELKRRNSALEHEMPIEKYMAEDRSRTTRSSRPRSRRASRTRWTARNRSSTSRTSLDWPSAEDTFVAAPAETAGEADGDPDDGSDESLWSRSRDFDWEVSRTRRQPVADVRDARART